MPASQTLFDAYPYTVVSLDYIKAERRRDSFARSCPALVVVDEAHACVGTHQSRQQRFELLKRLASDPERHLILLTATPHSGDEAAFDRLLSLLDPDFAEGALESEQNRVRLARHFVQRRRIDITGRDWGEDRVFPRHETAERPYKLTDAHRAFHDAVLDYCLGVVEGAGPDQRRRRLGILGHAGPDALRRLIACRRRERAAQPPCRRSGSARRSRCSTTIPTKAMRSMSSLPQGSNRTGRSAALVNKPSAWPRPPIQSSKLSLSCSSR